MNSFHENTQYRSSKRTFFYEIKNSSVPDIQNKNAEENRSKKKKKTNNNDIKARKVKNKNKTSLWKSRLCRLGV